MSKASYLRNRALGVTGAHLPTCLPAAFEKISPRHSLEPKDYRKYVRYFGSGCFPSIREANSSLREVLGGMCQNLGGLAVAHLETEVARDLSFLKDMVKCYVGIGWRVALVLDDLGDNLNLYKHVVGIMPEKWGRFELLSNALPKELGRLATLNQIFPYLYQPEDELTRNNRYIEANVLILPDKK